MPTKLHPQLQPYAPSSEDRFDAVKAAHLLNRAAFGGTIEEVAALMELGSSKAVDALMDFPDAGADEMSRQDVPDLSSLGDDYPRTFEDRRKMLAGKTEEERKALLQQFMMKNREAMAATMQWWLHRMASGPYPMQEKLAFFWHGHFTTSARDERGAEAMWNQNELLRRNAAGNFRTFVKQVARDPAMLDYLNNQQNRKAHPNENFAREVMELFTLGIGNYTEDDVKQAARAFTGWAHDGEDFIFRKFDHDTGNKTFFGRTGNFDGDDIIEMILQHKACAPYIARRLLTNFVMDDPPADVCQSLGNLLRENNWDLRPVLYTMFTSKLFYSPDVIGTQIKSPVQLVIGTMHLLDVEPPNPLVLAVALDQMGQVPFAPPNVKGWPGGRNWINTSTLFVRYNTAVWLAGANTSLASGGGNVARFLQLRGAKQQGRLDMPPNFAPTVPADDASAEEVADYWITRLIQRPIDADRRKVLIDSLGQKPTADYSLKRMVQLVVSMPEYQLC